MYLVVTKEVAEANNVEYLHRLVHMTWVVDVHGKLDDPEMNLSQPWKDEFVIKNNMKMPYVYIWALSLIQNKDQR